MASNRQAVQRNNKNLFLMWMCYAPVNVLTLHGDKKPSIRRL